jgi:hypothetical protein
MQWELPAFDMASVGVSPYSANSTRVSQAQQGVSGNNSSKSSLKVRQTPMTAISHVIRQQAPLRPSGDLDGDPGDDQEVEQVGRGLHRLVQRGGQRGRGEDWRRGPDVVAREARSGRAEPRRSRRIQ